MENKYYRVQAEVNLKNIHENLEHVKYRINTSTKLMTIIKADGYGHGAAEIAKYIDDITDAYGVAIYEEGIQLRNVGITKQILLLGYTSPEVYPDILKYDLTPSVFTFEDAVKLDKCAGKYGKRAVVHIAVDTGMSRIGFIPGEKSADEIKKIISLPNIEIEGIFTHFASADCLDKSFAVKQLERFNDFYNNLCRQGIKIPVRHVSNSAAIMEMKCNFEMVRSGIITYGLYPSGEVDKNMLAIKPAMELKTHVSHVKTVSAGTGIGYGSTFVTMEETCIATCPVGYADGYPYALANKGYVLIHGIKAPIAGRVCMDQFMIDVTDIDDVRTGDEVVLFGRQGNAFISVEEISALAGSFNYEFVCNISKRVPRKYIK
ncbi:alanine racemase [Porcipelethomonas sp.]|uniref:alanine racemase n=1 Tax=Porcipelethomonas sp. TaxID=2981675 RepID=UPI003EF2DC0E